MGRFEHIASRIPRPVYEWLKGGISSLAKALTTIALILFLAGCKSPAAPHPPAPPTITLSGDFK